MSFCKNLFCVAEELRKATKTSLHENPEYPERNDMPFHTRQRFYEKNEIVKIGFVRI